MTENRTASAPPKIIIERRYRARVEELWDLWTTKAGFESWWGPQGFRVEVRALEAKVGGQLRYAMIADAPEMVAAMKAQGQPLSTEISTHFSELQPYQRLAITSVMDFLPGVAAYDNTIAVEFHPDGDHVRMRVALEPLHTEDFSKMQQAGFTSQLGKLDQRYGVDA